MTRILDIRGTHGSGKSHVMHTLLEGNTKRKKPITGFCEYKQKEMTLGYDLGKYKNRPSTAIIGRYETQCGGCDGVGSADEICRRVRLFVRDLQYDNVLLEGILVAHTFKRYSELAKELEAEGHEYHFCFLSTPLATCITRVKQRRLKQGNTKPFNPKNCIHDYNQIWRRTRAKMKEAGHRVTELEWQDPLPQVMELLTHE